MIEEFAHRYFLDNQLTHWLLFIVILLVGIIFKKLISRLITYLIYIFFRKYSAGVGLDKFQFLLIKPFSFFISMLALYFAFERLHFPDEWNMVSIEHVGLRLILFRSFQVLMTISVTWIVLRFIDFMGDIYHYRSTLDASKSKDQLITFVKDFAKIFACIISLIFTLRSEEHTSELQ